MLINKSPNVSVIIPVYNGTNYLSEAINSVLTQTYKDFEILVIDDGSTDGTWDLIQSYGSKIRGIRKKNGGVASALNQGIKEMQGQWFVWLSHDDIFSNNRLEEDMIIVEANPNAKIIFCNANVINEYGELIEETKEIPIKTVTNPRDVLLLSGMNMCTMTVHKSCFDKIGLFNENNQTVQDVEMTLRLSCEFQFYLNNHSVTSVRTHPLKGTFTLSKQHKKDMLTLSKFIYTELSIKDFFPNLSENGKSKAWIWMGDQYLNFGADQYANEAYNFVISFQKNWLQRIQFSIYFKMKRSEIMRNIYAKIRRIF